MTWRSDLEIIGHHYEQGLVWDGDQISKPDRDRLITRGYLTRRENGTTSLTEAGFWTWLRWRHFYAVWMACVRLRWRWQERRRA